MDAAGYAAMSDPAHNFNFSRRWLEPPLERKRPGTGDTAPRAELEDSSSEKTNTTSDARGPWLSLEDWAEKMRRRA
jgi:hypothetical protein